jgi:hypothetical protein
VTVSSVIFDDEGNPLDPYSYAEKWCEERWEEAQPYEFRRYQEALRRQDKAWEKAVKAVFRS